MGWAEPVRQARGVHFPQNPLSYRTTSLPTLVSPELVRTSIAAASGPATATVTRRRSSRR